jgi:hypothetical protein
MRPANSTPSPATDQPARLRIDDPLVRLRVEHAEDPALPVRFEQVHHGMRSGRVVERRAGLNVLCRQEAIDRPWPVFRNALADDVASLCPVHHLMFGTVLKHQR